ncbi:MAG: hypothetical protein H8E85_04240 [Candidatus Marinimicrobia bacterium]|nr:hypothetical protein [Candidatus Neomarinimicrobiota bacterium]
MRYKLLIIFVNFLFSVSDATFAAESSIIPFQLAPGSKPMLHLGGLQNENGVNPVSGLQIQPTRNLLIGGVLSPRNIDNDLSLYHHILIGYIPDLKLLKFSTNIIQVGVHRYRFSEGGGSRWFSFSVTEAAQIGSFNLNVCWNKLFTQSWERNTVLVSTKIKFLKDLYLQPGAIAFFTPSFNYSPFLLVSVSL